MKGTIKKLCLTRITPKAGEWLFPFRCALCDRVITGRDKGICLDCLPRLRLVTPPWCMKCGKKVSGDRQLCPDCEKRQHLFARGRALFEYNCVRKSIYRFKYSGRREYADFYGEMCSRYLRDFFGMVSPDALVPVPLSAKRYAKRGYNQAQLLAEEIGKRLQIPVYSDLLLRQKNTAPLKGQNLSERQNNLKKAFIIGRNDVKLKTIIVIDDIYTTGSTIDEIGAVLTEAGVQQVYFVVLACGVGM